MVLGILLKRGFQVSDGQLEVALFAKGLAEFSFDAWLRFQPPNVLQKADRLVGPASTEQGLGAIEIRFRWMRTGLLGCPES